MIAYLCLYALCPLEVFVVKEEATPAVICPFCRSVAMHPRRVDYVDGNALVNALVNIEQEQINRRAVGG